jgi:hypothetical protein
MIYIVLLLAVLVAVGPLAAIWSLNTLFGLSIAYTLKTWAAALVLAWVIGGTNKSTGKKE